MSDKPTSV